MTDLRLTTIDESVRELYGCCAANKQSVNREFLLLDKWTRRDADGEVR